MKEFRKWVNNEWEWKVTWRREWFEWEFPQVDEFVHLKQKTTIKKEGEDEWTWKDEEGTYTVKSRYEKVQNPCIGENFDLYNMF